MNQSQCNSSDNICEWACFTHLETELENSQHAGRSCDRNLVWRHPCSDSVPQILLESLLCAKHWIKYQRGLHTGKKEDPLLFPKAFRGHQEVKKCPSHTALRLCVQYFNCWNVRPKRKEMLNYLNSRVGGIGTSSWLDRGTWNKHGKPCRTWSRDLLHIWSISDMGVRDWREQV